MSISSEPKTRAANDATRHDWNRDEVQALFALPLNDLLFEAQTVHRRNFDPNKVQLSTLLSIKTGGCPEDCAYCSQSVHNCTGLSAEKLMEVERVLGEAQKARMPEQRGIVWVPHGASRKTGTSCHSS